MRRVQYLKNKKFTVDGYLALDIAELAKLVDLSDLARQRRRLANVRSPAGGDVHYMDLWAIPDEGLLLEYLYGDDVVGDIVPVVTTRPHYGGLRYWFLCPGERCGRRVRILYGGKRFLCRNCHDLTYAVCQQAKVVARRMAFEKQMWRIRRTLKAQGGLWDPLPDPPPRMHAKTYQGLELTYDELLVWQQRLILQQVESEERSKRGNLAPAPDTSPPRVVRPPEPEPVDTAKRLTLGELAAEARVPYAFAKAALQAELIRPDQGRTTRRKRYRRRLASWLAKLSRLRQAGLAWEEIRAWTKRRYTPGHAHERRWPAGMAPGA